MALWPMIFTVGVYLSLLLCLYACVRIGMIEGWITGLLQFVMLAGFAVLHWLLESWAHVSAPFYDYPQNVFWDMIPNFDWSWFGFAPPRDACAQAVVGGISATVPLSGAIICFCLLWTARLLLTTPVWLASYRPAIAPFMVALIAMLFDGYLDPVAAISMDCQPIPEQLHAGLGFWIWHTEPRFADVWFSIPLFNFASWYAFPATVTAAALLLGWAANAIILGNSVAIFDGVLRLIILLALLTVAVTAPGAKPPIEAVVFIVGLIVISLFIVWRDRATYKTDNPWRWELVLPMLFYLLFPLAALFFSGTFVLVDTLVLAAAALMLFVICLAAVISPYMKW